MVKSLPANAADLRFPDSNLGSGRSPGGGNDNPLQYYCLENPMDGGAWPPTVHGYLKRVGHNLATKQQQSLCNNIEFTLSNGEGNGTPLQYSCLENPMEPGRLQSMGSLRVGHD